MIEIIASRYHLSSQHKECAKDFVNLFKEDTQLYTSLSDKINRLFSFYDNSGSYRLNVGLFNYLRGFVGLSSSNIFLSKFNVKKPKVFVSHSSNDVQFVKPFVDMLEKIGLSNKDLFCSSIHGFNIPLNENIYDYLRNEFDNFDLYVILMLSENYYNSSACLNEMGAAWALKSDSQSILLPKFEFKDIKGAIDPRKVCFKLDDLDDRPYRLTELKIKIIGKLKLENPVETDWERYKTDFFNAIDRVEITPIPTDKYC